MADGSHSVTSDPKRESGADVPAPLSPRSRASPPLIRMPIGAVELIGVLPELPSSIKSETRDRQRRAPAPRFSGQ
ncbi:hypothetical protein [Longimicrobium terrae]|uniref:Uncharacterized protein n=1 Tax=Longimicrobium terrae TaxID=1639882 RepID=A0A841GZP8_9BACT|nr:hypothetical protein [Longimicrobium terrae]MBB6071188.1 hypothetical protein [Longimicrobium terrae]